MILHELAHVWFNDSLFSGRWINEGFADQSAALAMAAAGEEQPQPEAIEAGDPGRLKLNDWSDPDLQAEVSDDQERYGYNTSWAVLDAITDEIGVEGFTKVIRAAEAGEVAYRGPGDPEELARTFDWRELLDLFEEVGGSAEAAALFQRHVVSEAESADFDARTVARGPLRRAARRGRGVGGADLGPTRHGGLAVRLRRGADDRRHGRARHQGRPPRRGRRPRGVRGPRPRSQLRAGDRSVRSGRRGGRRGRGRRGAARRGGGGGRRCGPARSGRSALLERRERPDGRAGRLRGGRLRRGRGGRRRGRGRDGRGPDGRRAPRARGARRWSSSPSAAGSSFVAGGARRPGRPNRATTRRWRQKSVLQADGAERVGGPADGDGEVGV